MADENQHWVPKFLIKNFAGSDGRVYASNITTDELKKLPPRRAASAPNFNVFKIDGKTVSYEDELEKIETRAAPIIARVVAAKSLAHLTEETRRRLSAFMAAQSFRTEAL